MSKAFLSYVRDDDRLLDYIVALFELNGIPYWRDKNDLNPGLNWREQLRQAITAGSFYIPFFSASWSTRESTMANEELLWAIDELRRRPTDRAWFIPFVLPEGRVPDREIGGGARLTDIQYISVDALGWNAAIARLLRALGVLDPKLDAGEPLAPGFPSSVALSSGWFTCERLEPQLSMLKPYLAVIEGLKFPLVSGRISRGSDGKIIAELVGDAPHSNLANINAAMGLDRVICHTDDAAISSDPQSPTRFRSDRTYTFAAGTQFPAMLGLPPSVAPQQFELRVQFVANGTLEGTVFSGSVEGRYNGMIEAEMFGHFQCEVEPVLDVDPRIG